MFEQALLAAAPVSNRLWSTCAGVTGQVALVGGLLLAPLIFPQVLPQVQSMTTLVAPGPPLPPPIGERVLVRPRPTTATHVFRCDLCAPPRVPKTLDMTPDEPPETLGV